MQAAPLPDADEARDNATFAAILAALSRPGSVQTLPGRGAGPIALALIDRECRVWADDPALQAVLRQTGAQMAPHETAGHVFLSLATVEGVARFADLTPGTPLYPDDGATVIAPAAFGSGVRLRLSGPGIDGHATIYLAGLHPSVWQARADLCRYPQGVEMLLVDGDRLLALPRSTQIEVL